MSDKLNKNFWVDFEKSGTIINIEKPNYNKIVNNSFVRNLRLELNLTQKVFSDVLGVSKKTIEKWEQGANPVKGTSARLLYIIDGNHELVNDLYKVNIVENISLDDNNFHTITQVTQLISKVNNSLYKVSTENDNYSKQYETNNYIIEGGIPCQQNSSYQHLPS